MYNSPRRGGGGRYHVKTPPLFFFFLFSFFLECNKKNKKAVELFLMGRETYLG